MAGRKTKTKKTRGRAAAPTRTTRPAVADLEAAVRTLQRRLKQLATAHEALREKSERQITAAKRAADRQRAAMLHELSALRHHEARAEALERLVTERDAAIAQLRARLGPATESAGAA